MRQEGAGRIKTKSPQLIGVIPMRELPAALAAMGSYAQFIVYKVVPSKTKPGKWDKFPADWRTGTIVDAHDGRYWTTHSQAIASAANMGQSYGVGYVFTEADPFWFLDIDNCLLADGSGWNEIATMLCGYFAGAAIEVSVSGKGLHIFGCGSVPEHGCDNNEYDFQFYTSRRFVALTGTNITGNIALDFTAHMPWFVDTFLKPDVINGIEQGWTVGPCDEYYSLSDDADLVRRAMNSKGVAAAFGASATFADLWNANAEVLGRKWPHDTNPWDYSHADAALAQHLAFWTGKDCDRIQRLMLKSSLVRDKWAREDYLYRTILGAVGRQVDVLQDKPVAKVDSAEILTEQTVRNGNPWAGKEEQLKLFEGCVYVLDQNKVFVSESGRMLKQEQFNVVFAGHNFVMDANNEKCCDVAWDAFTRSKMLRPPMADNTCFNPQFSCGQIIYKGGNRYVNTYKPIETPRQHGDPTPFIRHLEKVLPDPRDRQILLCYMAACIQHKGIKFQWVPLLQGVEGNGKTLFSRCVAEAIGARYVHWPDAQKLAEKFNGWMHEKLFFPVEDIYVPGHKAEVLEKLKPMITGGDGLEIEKKGSDQFSAEICGNFMFNCNRKDGLQKTRNDRRLAVFYTAQQKESDLWRDGMTEKYFADLYVWLKVRNGYAIVHDFLATYPIPDELNPATGCQRAPLTSSTKAAIAEGLGPIEQEIVEAVQQGLPGFSGGWISTIMLEKLLKDKGLKLSINGRKNMLATLGYEMHPGLNDGRVNNVVLPDNGKPRLYIETGSSIANLKGGSEIAKAYEQANNHGRIPFPM